MFQHLSPLQTYCLDEIGIDRYVLKNRAKPYQVLYACAEDERREQQNRVLLDKIIAALNWPQQNVSIKAVKGIDALLSIVNQFSEVDCVLWFGDEQPKQNHTDLICLPSLEKLAEDVSLKKQVWSKIKIYQL